MNKTSNIHASSYWAHFITRTPKNNTRILNAYQFRRIRNLSDKRGLVPSSYCFTTYRYPRPFSNSKNDSQNDPRHTLSIVRKPSSLIPNKPMSPTELSTILPYLASGARRVSLIKFQNTRVTRQDASRLLTLTREPNSLSLTFQPQSFTRVSILSSFFLCLFLCSFIYSHFVVCGRPRVHKRVPNSNLVVSMDFSIKEIHV